MLLALLDAIKEETVAYLFHVTRLPPRWSSRNCRPRKPLTQPRCSPSSIRHNSTGISWTSDTWNRPGPPDPGEVQPASR